jgi:hypothetical protein
MSRAFAHVLVEIHATGTSILAPAAMPKHRLPIQTPIKNHRK